MENYQQRVIDEKTELDAKLGKLQTFLAKDMDINEAVINRMRRQAEVMTEYSKILGERIEAF